MLAHGSQLGDGDSWVEEHYQALERSNLHYERDDDQRRNLCNRQYALVDDIVLRSRVEGILLADPGCFSAGEDMEYLGPTLPVCIYALGGERFGRAVDVVESVTPIPATSSELQFVSEDLSDFELLRYARIFQRQYTIRSKSSGMYVRQRNHSILVLRRQKHEEGCLEAVRSHHTN